MFMLKYHLKSIQEEICLWNT